jgi:hypothetical protein
MRVELSAEKVVKNEWRQNDGQHDAQRRMRLPKRPRCARRCAVGGGGCHGASFYDPIGAPRALRGSNQSAHPGGRLHGAAEAVDVNADHVAWLALECAARDGDDLVLRIGVGDQAGDAGAEGLERAQGGADAAKLGEAGERGRVGGAGDADVDRNIWRTATPPPSTR